jgi:DUF2939 family protein
MRRLALAIVGVALLGAGWFHVSPSLALNGLRDALESGDSDALADHVDFPALRSNLKDQLSAIWMNETSPDNPLGALAGGLATLLVDKILDSVVTPAGIGSLIRGMNPPDDGSNEPESDPHRRSAADLLEDARLDRESFDRVSAWVPNESGDQTQLVFRRYGLCWKLTNIVFPRSQRET